MENLADRWSASDVTELAYSATKGCASLELFSLEEARWIGITLEDVLLFNVSNLPGEMEPTFVADVTIHTLTKSRVISELRSCGYGWHDVETYPDSARLVHVEGGVVVDIIASKMSVKRSAKAPDSTTMNQNEYR